MIPFNIEGLEKARMSLTLLAKTQPKRKASGTLAQNVVESLYTEIRAARIAGHTWKMIADAISADVKVKLSVAHLSRLFNRIDQQYEAETDVSALSSKK